MNLGGPVWHVSVAASGFPMRVQLERECERQLAGVGDTSLGEWRTQSGRAFHLRRRLSAREQREVGPVLDVRGTLEACRRAERLGLLLTYVPVEVLAEEIGDLLR